MQMMRPHWTMLKLMMRFSVLRTVLKLRFSRVRKYFWLRDMVDSWPEILMTDSSREVVCSGEVPFFEGRSTRASFSTCKHKRDQSADGRSEQRGGRGRRKHWLMWWQQKGTAVVAMAELHTAISKSTNLSVTVLISLSKQNE